MTLSMRRIVLVTKDMPGMWERHWGPPEAPRPASEYPENWKVWENGVRAPLLTQDPDTIRFTSYEEV